MDDYGTDEGEETESTSPSPVPEVRVGIPWGAIAIGIWALALVIFSVQNAEHTTIDFLWWSFDMPVALLVIVTALITLILTGIGLAFYRRRRRKEALRRRDLESGA